MKNDAPLVQLSLLKASRPSFRRWRTWLMLSVIVLMVSGCKLQLGYSLFDNWLQWQIGRYIPLSQPQKQQLKKDIKAWHRWHRTHELPQYVEYFNRLDALVQQPAMTTDELQTVMNQGVNLWHQSIEPMLAPATALLANLTPQQTQALIEQLDEDDQDFRKKYLDMPLAKQKKERRKTFEKKMRKWIGSPTDQQYALVERWANGLHYDPALQSQQQTQWRMHLQNSLDHVNEFNDEALFYRTTTKLFVHYDVLWSDAFREMVQHNQKTTLTLFTDLHNTLSQQQKGHISERLLGYREDVVSLIKKGD